jgi:hypothetical protein
MAQTQEARQHHMQMKYLLAQMALQNPERFFATFGESGDGDYLADLWTGIGQDLPAEQRVAAEGLSAWHQASGVKPEILVLTFPPPAAGNEAYMLAAIRTANSACRVFCLERAVMPSTGKEFTILAELATEGRSNWGPGSAPIAEQFAEMVRRLTGDPSARPMAFVPTRQP